MTGALFGACAVLFALACILYYHGRFRITALAGTTWGVLAGLLVWRVYGPWTASLLSLLLLALPAAAVAYHALDVRKQFSLLPTLYSMPLAFMCGALLSVIVGVTLLWRTFS